MGAESAKEHPAFKSGRISPKAAFLKAIRLVDSDTEKGKMFGEKMRILLQKLARLTEVNNVDLKKFIYLFEAIFAIKYYYLKDKDKNISDKIRIEDINAKSFSADLLEKKPDFLLIPKPKYAKTYPTILVEFDGQQHYQPKGRMNFVRQKMYDAIKNNFFNTAPNHAIIRIPYNIIGESPTIDYSQRIYEYILPKIQQLIESPSLQKVASVRLKSLSLNLNHSNLYKYLFGLS